MSHFKSIAMGAAAATVVLVSLPANATLITQTVTFSLTATDWSQSGSFNLFNTNLGTLTSVTLASTVTGAVGGTVQNTSGGSNSFQLNVNATVFLGSGASGLNTYLQSFLFTLSAPYNTVSGLQNFIGVAPGATKTVAITYNPLNTAVSTSVAGGNFGLFEDGSGSSVSLDGATISGYGFTGGGNNVTATLTQSVAEDVVITYNYTPPPPPTGSPEPASMALLGMGLAGLGAIARRKRRV